MRDAPPAADPARARQGRPRPARGQAGRAQGGRTRAREAAAGQGKAAQEARCEKKVKAPPPPRKAAVIQKPEPLSQSERDVALLAAVVTRTKASQSVPPVLSVKWKQCAAAKSVAAARQCRAQLCAVDESAAECAGLKRASGKSRP
ncbi:hypothetical protein LP419_35795 [Massilia sp. H-1]|nr:hypothetical protein LP419_35795 [Massilia sp. H-1]